MPIAMSVDNRSPTITQSFGLTPICRIAVSTISLSGLPALTRHSTPVQASMAAMIAPASGSPWPPGNGQNRSGSVVTRIARRYTARASKAI